MSPANIHDSTKFVDVMELISEYLDDSMMDEIVSVYADKGYDSKYIRNYLRNHSIACCIPYKKNSKLGKDIIIAIDSTGVKVANRGEWMRQKWQKRRGFLKIHVAVDVKSKQITGLEITDDKSHDSKHFVSLVEQSKKFGNVTKTLADGAYDTKDNFSYCYYDNEILPAIRTRKNSSITTDCYPRRKSVLAQIYNYDLWKFSVSYRERWIVGVFSAFKRMFGEHVTSHKRQKT